MVVENVQRTLIAVTAFSIPFAGYHVDTGIISLSITNLLLVTTVLLILWNKFSDGYVAVSRLDCTILFLLVTALLFGVLSTLNNGDSFRWLPTVIGWLMLFGIVSIGIESRRDLQVLLHTIFLGAVTISVLAVVSSLFQVDFSPSTRTFYHSREFFDYRIPFTRTVGIALSHGEFGMYVTSILPLSLLYAVTEERRRYAFGAGILLFTVVFISQGRSTWLAMAVGFCMLFFLHPLHRRLPKRYDIVYRHLRVLGFAAAPPAFLALFFVFVVIGGSLQTRLNQVLISFKVIASQPLIGIGWSGGTVFPLFDGSFPHNAFLRYGVSLGIPVLLALITIIVVISISTVRTLLNNSLGTYYITAGVFAGFAAVMIEANLLPGFGKTTWLWLGILAANHKMS